VLPSRETRETEGAFGAVGAVGAVGLTGAIDPIGLPARDLYRLVSRLRPMGEDDSETSAVGGLLAHGVRAYLAGGSAREALRAVDIGALLDGQPVEEAIEREQAGKLLGRLLGRAIADELADGSRIQEVAVRLAGQRVGARLGEAAIVALLEYGMLASILDELRDLTTDDAVLGLFDEIEAAAMPDDARESTADDTIDVDATDDIGDELEADDPP
jgi:hypothetical protein